MLLALGREHVSTIWFLLLHFVSQSEHYSPNAIPLPPKRQTPSKRFFLNNLIQSGRNNISGQTILSAGNRHCIKQTREFQDLGEYVVELSRRIVGRDIYVVLPVGGRDGGTLLTLSKDESVHPTTQKRNGQGDAAPPHFSYKCFQNCRKLSKNHLLKIKIRHKNSQP